MHNHSFWIPPDNTTPHTTHPCSLSPRPPHILPPLSLLVYVCVASQGQGAIRHPSDSRTVLWVKKYKQQNHQSFLVPNSSVGDHADLSAKVQGNWPFQIRLEHQMQGSKVVLLYLLDWAAQCQACSWTELKWTIWPLGKAMLKRVLESFRTFRKEVFGLNNCKLSSL